MRRNTGREKISWVARTTLILICVILIPFLALTVILTNMAMNKYAGADRNTGGV